MNKWIVGAAIAVLASPLFAHTGGSVDPDTFVSYDGTVAMWLNNGYDEQATFAIEVTTKDGTAVAEDQWRSNIAGDSITLNPGEPAWFTVETRQKGKYYVCTKLESDNGVGSRICSRHWHR